MASIQWPAGRAAIIVSPICANCKRLEDSYYRECEAFDEIPDEIFDGLNDHRTPYPGDGGKRFVRFDESEPGAFQEPEPDDDDLGQADAYTEDDEASIDDILREIEREAAKKRNLAERLHFATPTRKIDLERMIGATQERFKRRMGDLAAQFREGRINYDEWARRGKAEIQDHVRAAQKLGLAEAQGKWPPSSVKLTDAQRKAGNAMVDRELKYFSGFRKDVRGKLASGQELTTAIDARARLYAGAVRSAANETKIMHEPEAKLRWMRHAEDSCETCIGNADAVFTATEWRELDVWPSHQTRCDGNCQCSLEPVKE